MDGFVGLSFGSRPLCDHRLQVAMIGMRVGPIQKHKGEKCEALSQYDPEQTSAQTKQSTSFAGAWNSTSRLGVLSRD